MSGGITPHVYRNDTGRENMVLGIKLRIFFVQTSSEFISPFINMHIKILCKFLYYFLNLQKKLFCLITGRSEETWDAAGFYKF